MIKYERLFDYLRNEGITEYRLKKEKIVSASSIQRMHEGLSISIDTLDKLCNYLKCDISDIIEYIPDDTLN